MWVGGSTASFYVGVVIWQAVGASPSQAGSGGPVGCPIINVASLGEVLEGSLEPSPPPKPKVGFGSRNDSKSFESISKKGGMVRQS